MTTFKLKPAARFVKERRPRIRGAREKVREGAHVRPNVRAFLLSPASRPSAAASPGPGRAGAHLLAKVFDEAVGEASQRRELERPGDGAAEGRVAQGVE